MSTVSIHAPFATHTVLHGVDWDDYEKLLEEIGDGTTRVSYLDGSMEIMSPLPEHEKPGRATGRLIGELTLEIGLPLAAFGSSTFRRRQRQAGLEPDECFYVQNEAKVRDMVRFDPAKYPPPDLAVEIEITRRSVAREPIYARLGVPELWRYDGKRLSVYLLGADKSYHETSRSRVFPFLPLDRFTEFLNRMRTDEQNAVMRDFRKWVRRNRGKWAASLE